MAYQKIYSREYWENFPSEKTAINKNRLNNIESGIDAIDDRVCALDTTKVDLTKANELVKEILWDESNGTLTVVKMNGSRAVIDTKLEKLAVNFTYNPQTQQLVIALDDGTVQNVDLSSLITEYEFLDSDTIAFEIAGGKVKAIVKNGSITENHLAPEYLAEIRTQVGRAEMSAKSADASEKSAVSSSALAKSYAVGGTGTRDGEDTDNAKYYAEQAKNASDVGALSKIVDNHISDKIVHMTESEHGVVSKLGESAEGTLTFNGKDVIGSTITVDDALSSTSANPVQNKVVTSNLTDLKYGEIAGGKNLANFSKLGMKTSNGITFEYQSNGSIKVSGTVLNNEGSVYTPLNLTKTRLSKGHWYTTSVKSSNTKSIAKLFFTGRDASTTLQMWETADTYYYLQFFDGVTGKIPAGTVIDEVLYPQIEEGTTATEYEPYIPSVKMLNGDVAELNKTVDTLKKSVSDGKTKVANAITDKGVETATDATFDVMAENISKIETGGGELHGATLAVSTEESTLFGQTVTLTLNGASVGTTVFADNGTCSFVVQNPGTYTITCGEANKDATVTSDNVVNKTVISIELSLLKIVTFADGTDAEIAKMIQAHYNNKINIADYWAVGDTRSVSLSAMSATGVGESHRAQTVQFVIGDFEHDDLATAINGHTKAAITLLQKDCLMDATSASNVNNGSHDTEKGYMNSADTNVGGWKSCARRTWCNNVYFNAFPSAWQSMVKTVNKKVSVGNNSSTIETVQDKIFLAAEIEIFGSTTYSFAGEGTQYTYYKNATANRYKMPKWGSSYVSHIYWQRSPDGGYSTGFCYVNGSGSANSINASNARGVAPCLCI